MTGHSAHHEIDLKGLGSRGVNMYFFELKKVHTVGISKENARLIIFFTNFKVALGAPYSGK